MLQVNIKRQLFHTAAHRAVHEEKLIRTHCNKIFWILYIYLGCPHHFLMNVNIFHIHIQHTSCTTEVIFTCVRAYVLKHPKRSFFAHFIYVNTPGTLSISLALKFSIFEMKIHLVNRTNSKMLSKARTWHVNKLPSHSMMNEWMYTAKWERYR